MPATPDSGQGRARSLLLTWGQPGYAESVMPAWVTLRDLLSKPEKQNQHLKYVSGTRKRVTLSLDAYFAVSRTCCFSRLYLLALLLTGCVWSGESVTSCFQVSICYMEDDGKLRDLLGVVVGMGSQGAASCLFRTGHWSYAVLTRFPYCDSSSIITTDMQPDKGEFLSTELMCSNPLISCDD